MKSSAGYHPDGGVQILTWQSRSQSHVSELVVSSKYRETVLDKEANNDVSAFIQSQIKAGDPERRVTVT